MRKLSDCSSPFSCCCKLTVPSSRMNLPDDEVIAELQSHGGVYRTDLDDEDCGTSIEKVGSDADGRAGGCTNIRLQIGPGELVFASIWVVDEEDIL